MTMDVIEEAREEAGEIEKEKTITKSRLGGAFVFRLPFAMDELAVLRRRVQIMSVPEEQAGGELLAISHAQAMFETYCIHKPHSFSMDTLRSWGPFIQMMGEVNDWHNFFRRSVGDEED